MRCVPFFIFLFNAAYAIPEEIEGSERETVLSVLTAAGANAEGDRKLSCAAITGCITLNTDCSCASCNNLSNCVAYDPSTCLCTGCSSSLYKVNTKGKCVCVSVTGSVLDKKCAVIGCSSGYTYLSTVKKCCPNVTNCGTYDSATCACTGCVPSIYSLKNGKCVCKTIKGCSQYDSNCSCIGCSSTYVFSSGKCVTQSPTPAPTASTPVPTTPMPHTLAPTQTCTETNQCSGTVSFGDYICDGKSCASTPCTYACGNVSFSNSQVTCLNEACNNTPFTNSNVTCKYSYGCAHGSFTDSVVTCGQTGGCMPITANGGVVYCGALMACDYSTFGPNTKVQCKVDASCGFIKLNGNGATVDCVTLHSCDSVTFTGTACCSSGYCPTGSACPTPAPTSAKPSTPTPSSSSTTAPTNMPVTPAPVKSCTAADPCYCTLTNPCTGAQSPGVYDCSGQDCSTNPCKNACQGATFTGGTITCHDYGCFTSTFTDSVVTCNSQYGCDTAVFNNGATTCNNMGACDGVNASGGSFNCNVGDACITAHFFNVEVTCSAQGCNSVTGSGGHFYCNDIRACVEGSFSNTQVSCGADYACDHATFDSNTIVHCLTTYSCQDATFKGGATCVSGGYCPTAAPTPAPTNTPQPTTPAPITPVPTPAPTNVLLTVMCPSGQYVTGLRIEFGAAINQIFGLLCSGSTSYLSTDGMGAHVHDTDLKEYPTNSGGYCQYSVGLLSYTPTNTVSSGVTLTDCTVNNVSQGPYGSPSKDVKQFTCPTGKKYVGISGTSESWTDTFGVYYPALLSQFSMICG